MSRYEKSIIRTSKYRSKKKNGYSTTLFAKVPERNDDMYFIAQEGDRCDNLAVRFYSDANLWWFIARVNDLKGMNIPAGTNLRIPVRTTSARGF